MRSQLLFTVAVCTLIAGCPGKKSSSKRGTQKIEAGSSNSGILKVSVEIDERDGTGVLSIRNTPEESTLTCSLEKEIFTPCGDGETFAIPSADGEYAVTVVARTGKKVVAVGEAHFAIGKTSRKKRKSATGASSARQAYNSDLTLEVDPNHFVDGRPFEDGMSVRRTIDVELKFTFPEEPLCEPELRCTTDRADGKFAPLCDIELGKSYKARTMPQGLNFLKVQATCGDRTGEPLTLFWYGVEDDYTYMGLTISYYAEENQYIYRLMNPSDCPQNLLTFECKYSFSNTFVKCRGNKREHNTIKNPPNGFEIRPLCNGAPYQTYSAVSD